METFNDTIKNNVAHDGSQKEQDYNANVPERSGISNPTATLKGPSADQVEPAVSLTVEFDILSVSSPVTTVCLDISPESSSGPRHISKGIFSQKETPSLGNALTLSNRFDDTFGDTTNATTLNEVEADLTIWRLAYQIETTDQETNKIATVVGKPRTISESSFRRHLKLNDKEGISSLPDAELFKNLSLIGYNILPNQRENIAKTSTMPHESSPRVLFLDADEGSMQQRIHKLMELYTSLQRQQSQMATKIKDQDIEISRLKARVKSLEDKERRREDPIQEDAPITGGIMDLGEELRANKSTKKGSIDTEEMVHVLSSMEAGEGSANLTKPHHTPSPQEHHFPQHDSPPLHIKLLLKPSPLGDSLEGLYRLLSLKLFHLLKMSLHLFQEMTDKERLSPLSLP
nr:hypothetical protein [Tanacetum cinerariifolium]